MAVGDRSVTKFPYTTDDWRVWYDAEAALWRSQAWSNPRGTISSKRLEGGIVRWQSDGKFLRFLNCECQAGIIAFDGPTDATVDVIRLLPRTQAIEVPAIPLRAKVKKPGA